MPRKFPWRVLRRRRCLETPLFPALARGRISPPRFLAECRTRQPIQCSFICLNYYVNPKWVFSCTLCCCQYQSSDRPPRPRSDLSYIGWHTVKLCSLIHASNVIVALWRSLYSCHRLASIRFEDKFSHYFGKGTFFDTTVATLKSGTSNYYRLLRREVNRIYRL